MTAHMERLILLRHGKAEPHAASGEDFDRRLAPRGLREAAEMGQQLAGAGVRPDLALVSPAARTRETWEAAQGAFPPAEARFDDELYNADAATIWRTAKQGSGTVVVVGHNPGLHELTLRLMIDAHAPSQDMAQAQRKFPPGAASVFAFGKDGRPAFEALHYPERRD